MKFPEMYIGDLQYNIGFMLGYAVYELNSEGSEFLDAFISTGVAEYIEEGDVRHISGYSGAELACKVLGTEPLDSPACQTCISETREFWLGYYLSYYVWYSERSYSEVLDIITYTQLLDMYDRYHEMDLLQFCDTLDNT